MFKAVNKLSVVTVMSFSAVLAVQSHAEKIKGDAICSKIKTCALESIEGQQIPEQMMEILMSQLDTQCATAFKSKEKEIVDAGLTDEANACADSMVSLSCEKLMSPEGGANKTQECEAFEASAKKAGIDVN
ncbi:hypothetical protein NBRC116583_04880 [Arenicella sp. 4NH20-0111]|uniref:hypothetical protein n=1 Tax=Arenicella sp. 4NH20-0111 TaxID=3127648 RepID=UPI003105D2DF